jgi:hypothetical protein
MRRTMLWVAALGLIAGLPLIHGACGASASSQRQLPATAATAAPIPDGGLDPLASPPLTGKGVIVPGDPATTGIGDSANPGSSTGTNGRSVGPTVGSPGN